MTINFVQRKFLPGFDGLNKVGELRLRVRQRLQFGLQGCPSIPPNDGTPCDPTVETGPCPMTCNDYSPYCLDDGYWHWKFVSLSNPSCEIL